MHMNQPFNELKSEFENQFSLKKLQDCLKNENQVNYEIDIQIISSQINQIITSVQNNSYTSLLEKISKNIEITNILVSS